MFRLVRCNRKLFDLIWILDLQTPFGVRASLCLLQYQLTKSRDFAPMGNKQYKGQQQTKQHKHKQIQTNNNEFQEKQEATHNKLIIIQQR